MIPLQWRNFNFLSGPSRTRFFCYLKRFFTSFYILFFLLFSNSTISQFAWIPFLKNNYAVFFYDPGSIKIKNKKVLVWVLLNYSRITNSGEKSVLYRQEFDCLKARYRTKKFASFSEKNGKGELVTKLTTSKNWKFVKLNSVDSSLLKVVCNPQ